MTRPRHHVVQTAKAPRNKGTSGGANQGSAATATAQRIALRSRHRVPLARVAATMRKTVARTKSVVPFRITRVPLCRHLRMGTWIPDRTCLRSLARNGTEGNAFLSVRVPSSSLRVRWVLKDALSHSGLEGRRHSPLALLVHASSSPSQFPAAYPQISTDAEDTRGTSTRAP
jgi:hypothetical protein